MDKPVKLSTSGMGQQPHEGTIMSSFFFGLQLSYLFISQILLITSLTMSLSLKFLLFKYMHFCIFLGTMLISAKNKENFDQLSYLSWLMDLLRKGRRSAWIPSYGMPVLVLWCHYQQSVAVWFTFLRVTVSRFLSIILLIVFTCSNICLTSSTCSEVPNNVNWDILQVAATTNKEVDAHIPNYPSLPPQLICQLHNITMHVRYSSTNVAN